MALGWTPLDLFGCDRGRPFARVDRVGLLWLLAGNRLVNLTADHAVIEMRVTGSRQSFYRKPAEPGCIPAWELTPPAKNQEALDWDGLPRRLPPACRVRPIDFRAFFMQRLALHEQTGCSRAEAEEAAWQATAGELHVFCGEHVDPSRCAGCSQPIHADDQQVLNLPHGECVHVVDEYRCVIAFGRRWKRQVGEALTKLGILTPPSIAAELEDG